MGRARHVLGVVGEPMNGVTYVRFHQPFTHLRDRGYELSTLGRHLALDRTPSGFEATAARLRGIDLVLFPQNVASPVLADGTRLDLVGQICRRARDAAIPIVHSIDDWLPAIEAHNPAYARVHDSIANQRRILDSSDAVFVTTEALRQALPDLGKPVYILPNAVDFPRWRSRPRGTAEPRVGWAGSGSHVRDVLLLLPAIERLQRRLPFLFVLQGLTPHPLADEARNVRRRQSGLAADERETAEAFLELVDRLQAIRHIHVPFTDMETYFRVLPALDLTIGLCPLEDTEFNRHKSALKFYEYAACGTMTVASAVGPYADEVSVTVGADDGEWCEVLEQHLQDPPRREDELARQQAFVRERRDIAKIRRDWAEALQGSLRGAGRAALAEG